MQAHLATRVRVQTRNSPPGNYFSQAKQASHALGILTVKIGHAFGTLSDAATRYAPQSKGIIWACSGALRFAWGTFSVPVDLADQSNGVLCVAPRVCDARLRRRAAEMQGCKAQCGASGVLGVDMGGCVTLHVTHMQFQLWIDRGNREVDR